MLPDVRSRIRCSLKGSRTDLEDLGPTTTSFHGGLLTSFGAKSLTVVSREGSRMMILSEGYKFVRIMQHTRELT